MQTTQPLFRSNPLSSDSQPTSAIWIRWIGYGCKNSRLSTSVRRSWSCLSDLWDSQSNANPITVQCKEGNWHAEVGPTGHRPRVSKGIQTVKLQILKCCNKMIFYCKSTNTCCVDKKKSPSTHNRLWLSLQNQISIPDQWSGGSVFRCYP